MDAILPLWPLVVPLTLVFALAGLAVGSSLRRRHEARAALHVEPALGDRLEALRRAQAEREAWEAAEALRRAERAHVLRSRELQYDHEDVTVPRIDPRPSEDVTAELDPVSDEPTVRFSDGRDEENAIAWAMPIEVREMPSEPLPVNVGPYPGQWSRPPDPPPVPPNLARGSKGVRVREG